MISDLWHIGNDIRNLPQTLEGKNTFERVRLADLLEHIGYVLQDTVHKLNTGMPGKPQQIELLSEELYFKLAFMVGEMKAQTISSRLQCVPRLELLNSTQATGSFNAHDLMLLEEAACHFLDTSKLIRHH